MHQMNDIAIAIPVAEGGETLASLSLGSHLNSKHNSPLSLEMAKLMSKESISLRSSSKNKELLDLKPLLETYKREVFL